MNQTNRKQPFISKIPTGFVSKGLLLLAILVTIIYLTWWLNPNNPDNKILYGMLFFGEIFHIYLLLVLFNTVWPRKIQKVYNYTPLYTPTVDIYIPTVNEPVEIVKETVIAAKNIDYPKKKVYILNDGFVAKNDNWKAMEKLAKELQVVCITRKIPGGAKAGNVNNALSQTNGEIVVIFDADMIAYEDFLRKTIPYFQDEKVAFVQTPQYYKNYLKNEVTRAAWEQQAFFYGPIMIGKESTNSSFICGTNVAIRRDPLMKVGGMNTATITEDVLTSLYIHKNGWKSFYVDEILSEGLAPEDLLSYFKQQLRWARGALDLFFKHNPLFKSGLSFNQRLEYLSSSLYYMSSLAILIDIIMPLFYLALGWQPVKVATVTFSFFFLPYIFLVLLIMYLISDGTLSFRAISFSFSSFTLQLQALFSILTGIKMGFVVTPKTAQKGRYLNLAYPHIAYIIAFCAASIYAFFREGLSSAVAINVAWGLFNIILFIPFIRAAMEEV